MVTAIYSPGKLKMLGVCDGPDVTGRCPRMKRDGRAFCGGCDIVLSRDDAVGKSLGIAHRRFRVYEQTTRCPLASPAVGLRFVQPDRGYFSPFATD